MIHVIKITPEFLDDSFVNPELLILRIAGLEWANGYLLCYENDEEQRNGLLTAYLFKDHPAAPTIYVKGRSFFIEQKVKFHQELNKHATLVLLMPGWTNDQFETDEMTIGMSFKFGAPITISKQITNGL